VQLNHSFSIPVPVDEAWVVLRDIQRVAPCMPGATIDEVSGDDFTGGVKVKVGPITMTYKGEASFVNVDEDAHRATIEAKGRETRGSGTARATVTAELQQAGERKTDVSLVTDLAVTGKPAQFGRGVMADVGSKLIGQFAECLSSQLAGTTEPEPAAAAEPEPVPADATSQRPAPPPMETQPPRPAWERPTDEAIDLFDVAGGSVLRRFGPVAGGVVALLVLLYLLLGRRRRRARKLVRAAKREAKIERKVAKARRRLQAA
jgi:carbon monoxide dehydrogenase subunit G